MDDRVETQEIEKAWNSILGTFSVDDLLWASGLRRSFRTAILSNTNELHRASFEEMLRLQTEGNNLTDYFDGVYYSQLLGLRKPDKDVFLRVLEFEGWHARETLFVDDNQQNLQSAANLGMGVVLHPCNAPLRLHLEACRDLPFHQFSSLS
jgi:putative hydrolase of the HAD superfamily